jgi:hypothetical protein
MVLVKMNNKWVHVVKFATDVAFSTEKNWFMVNSDFHRPDRFRMEFKWVPASTRFDAVKEMVA